MKKLILSIAVLGAVMMASCSAEKKAEDKGEAIKAKIENCQDSDSLKMYVKEAQEYAEQLVKEGKDQAATDFLNVVTPVVQAKDPVAAIGFKGLELEAKADSAVEAAKESAKEVAESAKDVAKSAKDAAADKVSDVKDAAANSVDAAKTKVADAAQKGADKVKDLMGK